MGVKALKKVKYGLNSGFRHGFKNVIFSKFFFGFITSLSVLISSHNKADRIKDNLDAKFNEQEDTFDFIVVGGGSAGSLLANRLSEGHKVLLLEAGGEPHPLQRIPGMSMFMLNHPEIDWMHRTVPQRRACFSSPRRRASWSQGLNLGGSSNLNFMMHLRGSPRDYDHWAKVTGDDSWNYEALLPYFRRHENYQGDSPDREAHGFDGELRLEVPSYTGMAKEFIRAGQELGYEHVDLNARYDEGFDTIFYPIDGGERRAAYSAFLEPCRERDTLVIRKYAHVNKLLIRGHDTTAYGVEYDRHGRRRYAHATKEVILAAGTVESAKLLMLSGIGPKTHLADLGISLVADLPVGKNVQDHLATFLGPFFIDPPRSYLIDRDITLKSFYEYKADGNGPMSSSLFQAAAMISSKKNKWAGSWNWPDIQLLFSSFAAHKTFAKDLGHAFHLNSKPIRKYTDSALGRDSFFIAVSPSRPFARGEITLEKRDPYAPVSINPHYLENDHDLGIMIEGIKTTLYLVENTTSFQDLRARFTSKKFPGCEHMPFRSDAYFECYIRHFSLSLSDPVGSCGMGHPHMGHEGVVDSELQVFGVNHLRVVDASVMPTIPGAPVEAAVYMIAEKGADIILEAWRNRGHDEEKHHGHGSHMDENHHHHDEEHDHHHHDGPPPDHDNFVPHKLKDDFNFHPNNDDHGHGRGFGDGPPPGWMNEGNDHGPDFDDGPPPNYNDGPPPGQHPMYGPNASDPPPGVPYGPDNNGPPPWQNNNNNGPPPSNSGWSSNSNGPPNNNNNNNGPPPNSGWYSNNNPGGLNNNGPPPNFARNQNNAYWPPAPSDMPPIYNSSFITSPSPENSTGNPNTGINPPNNNGSSLPSMMMNNNGSPPSMMMMNNGSLPVMMMMNNNQNGAPPPIMANNGPPPQNNNGSPPSMMLMSSTPQTLPISGNSSMQFLTDSSTNSPISSPSFPVIDHPNPANSSSQPSSSNSAPIFANNFDFTTATEKPSRFDQDMESTTETSTTTEASPAASRSRPRPQLPDGEMETKFRPGLQISNPFPDEVYRQEQEDFRQRYPITSSVEYFNNVPTIAGLSFPDLGPIRTRPTGTGFSGQIGNQFLAAGKTRNKHKNVPSSASIPDIYYKIKDGSSLNNLKIDEADLKKQQQQQQQQQQNDQGTGDSSSSHSNHNHVQVPASTRSPYWTNPLNSNSLSTTPTPNPYYVNASPKYDNSFGITTPTPNAYYLNASPSSSNYIDNLVTPTTPRPDFTTSTTTTPPWTPLQQKPSSPGKITILKSIPGVKGRVVRIKSGNIGVSFSTTSSPSLDDFEDHVQSNTNNKNKIKIRIKHKNMPHRFPPHDQNLDQDPDGYFDNHQNIEPYFSQTRNKLGDDAISSASSSSSSSSPSTTSTRTSITIKKSQKKPRIFQHLHSPITITPRPLLSVTIWPDEHGQNGRNGGANETESISTTSYPNHNFFAQSQSQDFERFTDFPATLVNGSLQDGGVTDSQTSSTMILSALAEATMDVLRGRDPTKLYDDDGKEIHKENDNTDDNHDSLPSFSDFYEKNHQHLPEISTTIQPPTYDDTYNPPALFDGTDHPGTFIRPPFHLDQNSLTPIPLPFGKSISRPPWTPSALIKMTTTMPDSSFLDKDSSYSSSSAAPGFSNLIRNRYNYQMIVGGKTSPAPDPARFPTSFQELVPQNKVKEHDSTTEMSATSFAYADDNDSSQSQSSRVRRLRNRRPPSSHGTGLPRPTTTHKPVLVNLRQNEESQHQQEQKNRNENSDNLQESQNLSPLRKKFTSFFNNPRSSSVESFGFDSGSNNALLATSFSHESPISGGGGSKPGHQSPRQLISEIMGEGYSYGGEIQHQLQIQQEQQRYENEQRIRSQNGRGLHYGLPNGGDNTDYQADNQRNFAASSQPQQNNLQNFNNQNLNNFQQNNQNLNNNQNFNAQQQNFHNNQQLRNPNSNNFDIPATPPEENFNLNPENLQLPQSLNFQSAGQNNNQQGLQNTQQNFNNQNHNTRNQQNHVNNRVKNAKQHVFVFGENNSRPTPSPRPTPIQQQSFNQLQNNQQNSGGHSGEHIVNLHPPQNIDNNFNQNHNQGQKQHFNDNNFRPQQNIGQQNFQPNQNNAGPNHRQNVFGQNLERQHSVQQNVGQNSAEINDNRNFRQNNNVQQHNNNNFQQNNDLNNHNANHNSGQNRENFSHHSNNNGPQQSNQNFRQNHVSHNQQKNNHNFHQNAAHSQSNQNHPQNSGNSGIQPMIQSDYSFEHHTPSTTEQQVELTPPSVTPQSPQPAADTTALHHLSRPDFLSHADPSPQYDYLPSPSSDPGQVSLTYDDTGSTSALDQPVLLNGDILHPIRTNTNGSNQVNVDIVQVMITHEEQHPVPDLNQVVPQQQDTYLDQNNGQNVNHPGNRYVLLDPHPFDGLLTPTGTPSFGTTPRPLPQEHNSFVGTTPTPAPDSFHHLTPFYPEEHTTPVNKQPAVFGSRKKNNRHRDPFSNFGDDFTTTTHDFVQAPPLAFDHHHVQDGNFGFTLTTPVPPGEYQDFGSSSTFDPVLNNRHHVATSPPPSRTGQNNQHNQNFNEIRQNPTPPPNQYQNSDIRQNPIVHQDNFLQTPTPTPHPGPRQYTIYSNPDSVDITTEEPGEGQQLNNYDNFDQNGENRNNFQYRKGVTDEAAELEAEGISSTTENSLAMLQKVEKLQKSNHLRRRADILQQRTRRRNKRRRNFHRSGGQRFDDDDDGVENADDYETERPFRRRNRRPNSRRRMKEDVENYPFKRKRSSTEQDYNYSSGLESAENLQNSHNNATTVLASFKNLQISGNSSFSDEALPSNSMKLYHPMNRTRRKIPKTKLTTTSLPVIMGTTEKSLFLPETAEI